MPQRSTRRWWPLLACVALFAGGCDGQDAERLSRIGRKIVDRATAQTDTSPGRLPGSLQSIRGGWYEITVDARVASRLRWDKNLEGSPIQVQSLGSSSVKLTGTVATLELRQRAVRLADSTVGVETVIDELLVQP
jgi:BON domain